MLSFCILERGSGLFVFIMAAQKLDHNSASGVWALRELSPDVLLAALISFQQVNPLFLLQTLVHLLTDIGAQSCLEALLERAQQHKVCCSGSQGAPCKCCPGLSSPSDSWILQRGGDSRVVLPGIWPSALCLGICLLKSSIHQPITMQMLWHGLTQLGWHLPAWHRMLLNTDIDFILKVALLGLVGASDARVLEGSFTLAS